MTQCLRPLHIKIDDEGHTRQVPCGRCNACLVRSRMEWTFRLAEEQRQAASSFFVTLTYDNEHIPISTSVDVATGVVAYHGAVDVRDCQLFVKRLRKALSPVKLRFYLVSEYGPNTFRPHYHMCAFLDEALSRDEFDSLVRDAWPSPNITVSSITPERIRYVTEYCLTRNSVPGYYRRNFRLVSRNPGIGASYVPRMTDWHLREVEKRFDCLDKDGNHCNMPRFYREKIYPHEVLEERTAQLEADFLAEEIRVSSLPDYDRDKALRDKAAFVQDYTNRTNFFLNKKQKKL